MVNYNLTDEMSLLSQLDELDDLIEDLKLHTPLQVMSMDGVKTVSDEEFENNRNATQGIRDKIKALLDVLEDVKANSMDELSPLGKMRVDQSIRRSQFNIDQFDEVSPRIVRSNPQGDFGVLLPAMLEQIMVRSRKLQQHNQTYMQYLLSSKMNPKFDICKDEKVKDLISRMKAQITALENIICGLSEGQKEGLQPLFELINYSKDTVEKYEKYRMEHTDGKS